MVVTRTLSACFLTTERMATPRAANLAVRLLRHAIMATCRRQECCWTEERIWTLSVPTRGKLSTLQLELETCLSSGSCYKKGLTLMTRAMAREAPCMPHL